MTNAELKKITGASRALASATERVRDSFLAHLAAELRKDSQKIIRANEKDVARAKRKKLPASFIERLTFTEKSIRHLEDEVKSLKRLDAGLGRAIEKRHKDGMTLEKVRVPLGVILVIYEARPEVTVDVAALCVKSGNAAILKGGTEALETNKALYRSIKTALKKAGLSSDSVRLVETGNRKVTNELLKRSDVIDLVIARGGYAMVKAVEAASAIPVLAHSAGGARIYVDASADLDMAERILVNAKITKPAACNSLDTILVDRAIAKTFVPRITKAMKAAGVEVSKKMDWDEETLGMKVGITTVKGIQEAIVFTNTHGKKHSEGIIARDQKAIAKFMNSVDAAALFANASTRLHDGFVFGLGAEMGISTSKLHARGPVGLKELTSYKWEVYGTGNLR